MLHVVPLGIDPEGYGPPARVPGAPFRVGFFARVAPEKGLHLLAESYVRLRRESDFSGSALEVAGYLAPEHRGYLRGIERRMKEAGLAHEFHYRGELDRAGKIEFLRSLNILSVPSTYDEPKGIFLLEAMASGVAVVQPRLGAFPEILERTGGGVMVEPGDAASLADGIYGLWKNPGLAAELGRRAPRAFAGISAPRRWRRARSKRSRPSPPHRPMLEISNVTKQYPTPRGPLTVLSGVSLGLNRGEAAAIMGPSGSGKSTLLYIAGALEPPTAGTVTLGGVNPYKPFRKRSWRHFATRPSVSSSRTTACCPSARFWRTCLFRRWWRTIAPAIRRARESCSVKWSWKTGWITVPQSSRAARNSASRWREP